MMWGTFFATMLIVMTIVFLQWPKMKTNPKKDKTAFIVLLVIGLLLSMLDLQYMKGPTSVRQFLFKPFVEYMQKYLF
ncbi:hypothetical protein [Sporosarcina koreensis]|uniref:hypothetical protein n=1 Tax=Sporosarcina koreensis TaxID=334735 RepID=UPI0039C9BD24